MWVTHIRLRGMAARYRLRSQAVPRPPLLRLGQVVRDRRKELGLSQEDLAHRARLSVRTIQEWERLDAANPQLESLDRLAEALRLSLSELIERLDPDLDDGSEEAEGS
jgi:transcriptional regulator with XRE-family HTH domain